MQLPVIAEVSGVAAAAGCQLVSTCDIVVASEDSSFSVPGLKAGLFCSTPGIPLSRTINHKLSMDMLLTARSISAKGICPFLYSVLNYLFRSTTSRTCF